MVVLRLSGMSEAVSFISVQSGKYWSAQQMFSILQVAYINFIGIANWSYF